MALGVARRRDRSAGSRGPHCRARLDAAQFVRLEAELGRGPVAHGWGGGQGWTLARVAALIHRLLKVGYTGPGVSLLLRRNGWSCQVAGRRAIERDEQAVEVWKQEVWPQVEPLRRTWVPGSVSPARPVKDSGRPRVILGAGADTGRR